MPSDQEESERVEGLQRTSETRRPWQRPDLLDQALEALEELVQQPLLTGAQRAPRGDVVEACLLSQAAEIRKLRAELDRREHRKSSTEN